MTILEKIKFDLAKLDLTIVESVVTGQTDERAALEVVVDQLHKSLDTYEKRLREIEIRREAHSGCDD